MLQEVGTFMLCIAGYQLDLVRCLASGPLKTIDIKGFKSQQLDSSKGRMEPNPKP
jgi:hypothetical protein